ncbi:MAG TPA: potassium channel family protein [Solirubrobacterales bacterium]|jgi:voltage-gated potassium channel|nr:potassium channel family protein [Solirubrobacterales bacterium]
MSDFDQVGHGKLLRDQVISGRLTVRRAAIVISLFSLSLTTLAALLVFLLDREDFPNLGVSLWWAVQTVTTVGYGDFVPHNAEGRIFGGIVMLLGVSLVAVVTAVIAAAFIHAATERVAEDPNEHPLADRLDEIVARLDRIERGLSGGNGSPPSDAA